MSAAVGTGTIMFRHHKERLDIMDIIQSGNVTQSYNSARESEIPGRVQLASD